MARLLVDIAPEARNVLLELAEDEIAAVAAEIAPVRGLQALGQSLSRGVEGRVEQRALGVEAVLVAVAEQDLARRDAVGVCVVRFVIALERRFPVDLGLADAVGETEWLVGSRTGRDQLSVARECGSECAVFRRSQAGGQLTERVRQQPYIIVLFDEVEKAHPRILDILLQVIEEGRLTDGRGNVTYFSETVIILTSNLGSQTLAVPVITDEVRDEAMEEVRTYFRPEFLNRLDEHGL